MILYTVSFAGSIDHVKLYTYTGGFLLFTVYSGTVADENSQDAGGDAVSGRDLMGDDGTSSALEAFKAPPRAQGGREAAHHRLPAASREVQDAPLWAPDQ